MDNSDFDLLCEGASPEEAKRLRKVLADWCAGDEKGFPAQLALLTRAQWRAAATVPRAVQEARQCLQQQFAEQHRQLTALVNQLEQVTSANLREQRRLVDKLASDSAELETGAEKWTEVTTEFQTATKRLAQLCADLQSRPWRSHWVLLALLLIATFIAGYFIALYRAH
ncbi:MAG: hypothetical protein DME19_14785 [Verrucomicrobia bacterium]|nr:MAG: hypothetical protein DME19_14785 [Verrucomicrobiota bacterium]